MLESAMVDGGGQPNPSLFRQRVLAGSREASGPWWQDASRARTTWWEQPPQPQPELASYSTDAPVGGPEISRDGLGVRLIPALAALALLMVIAHVSDPPQISRVLVPLVGVLGAIGFAGWLQRLHPDEPWLRKYFILGMVVKIAGTVLRYTTLLKKGQLGDASVYDTFGVRYANSWLGRSHFPPPTLANLKSSNFMRWFTGIVYYLFGRDLIAGFFVFSLIAFAGSYLWYRAAVIAVPFLDRKLFFILITFAPSIVFWPAGVGKEALMEFGLGSDRARRRVHAHRPAALRTSRRRSPARWLVYVVRAHLLGLAAIALAFAYLFGRQRSAATRSELARESHRHHDRRGDSPRSASPRARSACTFATLSPSAVQSELQATSVSTTQGHSGFTTNVSLSPLHLPQDAVTVLLRPFPWEVQSKNQILASLEGIGLVAFMVYRRKSLALSLRLLRRVPFLFYAWILTLLYVLLFQAFGNFGLLGTRAIHCPSGALRAACARRAAGEARRSGSAGRAPVARVSGAPNRRGDPFLCGSACRSPRAKVKVR